LGNQGSPCRADCKLLGEEGNGTRCLAKDCFSMTKDHGYRTTDEDADWSAVAMAAIAAIVLLGIPTICVLCR
jgi:hypothetical protein